MDCIRFVIQQLSYLNRLIQLNPLIFLFYNVGECRPITYQQSFPRAPNIEVVSTVIL